MPLPHTTDLIDVVEVAPELAFTFTRQDASPELEAALERIEAADLLIVGTPISKGSYTGMLKHLLDLLTASKSEDHVPSPQRVTNGRTFASEIPAAKVISRRTKILPSRPAAQVTKFNAAQRS